MAKGKGNPRFDFARMGASAAGNAVGTGVCLFVAKMSKGKLNPNILGIGKVILGAFVPEINPNMAFFNGGGAGMMSQGFATLAQTNIPQLAGIGQIDEDIDELLEEKTELLVEDVDFEDVIEGAGDNIEDVLAGAGDDLDDVLGAVPEDEDNEVFD